MMAIRITPAVKALMITMFGAFIVQQTADQFMGGNIRGIFALIPYGFVNELKVWQIFTYSFLHADVLHLFLNLLMLAFIGGEIEAMWGTRRFLTFYFFCVAAAGFVYLMLQVFVWKEGLLHSPMVGASGGIYGLLMAYGLIFAERVLLFMMLFPMKAKHFIWILAGVEFMSTVFSGRGGLSSAAHLGGMVAGFGYLYARAAMSLAQKRRQAGLDWAGRKPVKKKKKAGHLRLVTPKPGASGDDEDESSNPKTWH
jgi:membrane associated rhomboid family serine protease